MLMEFSLLVSLSLVRFLQTNHHTLRLKAIAAEARRQKQGSYAQRNERYENIVANHWKIYEMQKRVRDDGVVDMHRQVLKSSDSGGE